jgi:predicted DNA-binding transcriptional regulator AlpA
VTIQSELTRQQLCATLGISESTVRRLELDGLPFTPVGLRAKRYNLAEVKAWLKTHQSCPSGKTLKAVGTSDLWSAANEFTASCRKAHLRVMPST